MSKKILVSYNFNQNEIQNARVHNVAGNAATPVAGQIWFDTTNNLMKWQNNAGVINPLDRANHSGTQTASTISDFASTAQGYRLDQFAAPTADISFNSHKLTNLANGASAQDAATYGQLLAVQNGTDWKQSVRAASTTNVAALSGLLTIDGITLVAGDRVLLKDQTTGSQNGIYVAAAGAWARAADANTSANVTPDMALFVEEGTTNADTQWRITTNGPITLDTTTIVFTQMGAGSSYTQGNGISISGSTISVDATVVARKAAATIGDGAATSIAVTHSLGTKDVTFSVRQVSDDAFVECDAVSTSTTQLTLSFAVAPAANALRVTIHG